MIDVEKAIMILSDEKDSGELHNYYSGEYAEAMRMAITALREKQERESEPSGWVSVEDRLPRGVGKYNVAKDGFVFPATYLPEMKVWFGEFSDNIQRVTHWQPLPEPPKEGTK